MRILIFGATGVLGRATIPHLQGHTIAGTTRAPGKLPGLAAMDVEGIVCDAYDRASVESVARAFRPDVVVNFLTDLAGGPGPANSRIRREAAPNVTAAARAAGARRLVVESIAFPTAPESAAAVDAMERDAQSSGLEVLIVRFGRLWGPGTWSSERAAPPAIEIAEAGRRAATLVTDTSTGTVVLADGEIAFNDGAAYERYMGRWSQLAGEAFLDWLRPPAGLRWLDVGCGNGAFTQMLAERCAPAAIHGIDPSEAQLAFARARPGLQAADLRRGDAMALPLGDGTVDAAVMPLVIFFVPEPARGVAEMARVVAPEGGIVCAYAWDMLGGGFPYAVLQAELKAGGVQVPKPPHPEASDMAVLHDLWAQAGLEEIETRAFTVERSFSGFDDYWQTVLGAPSAGHLLVALSAPDRAALQQRLRARFPGAGNGPFTLPARCHAIKGRRGRPTRRTPGP